MFRLLTSLCLLALLLTGCRHEPKEAERKLKFDAFVPLYNRYIENWLKGRQAETEKELAKVSAELATAEGSATAALETKAEALRLDQEKWDFRLGLGPYLKFATPSDIPSDLVWENGLDQPEIGDPSAKEGGVLRRYILEFPPTLRPFGSNSNHLLRGELYDYLDIPLVGLHPDTMKPIPGLAREWATSKDGRTTYFRIDPEARYSDGVPIRAKDFLLSCYIMASDNILNPAAKQYFREILAQITMYDDLTISVSLSEAVLFAPLIAAGLPPAAPHFYSEYGPDYEERYQWRTPPATGAYEIRSSDIVKGVSLTQSRVHNWWAKDRKYYRYRFNPDKLVYKVVRDESKAFELFRAGELDTFSSLEPKPSNWYDKSEIEPVHNGYIERSTFYNRYPKVPRGLHINVHKAPLNDQNVRIGIHHSMHFQKVINVLFRGSRPRLNAFNEGYGMFSDPSIKARPYDIQVARAAFAQAGYTHEGNDGILTKPDGTRLSVSVSYPSMPEYDRILAILREDAIACGLEVRLDGHESSVFFKKLRLKQHEIALAAWGINPPTPDYFNFLHSTNAIDEKGNLKPDTNNIFSWHRADTDTLSEKVRNALTEEELKEAAWKLQHIIHDEALFVPGYAIDYVHIGSWRWVKWPNSETTRFSPPVVYDPHEAYVLWVDEDLQAETQAALRSGKTFAESTRTFDDYRVIAPDAKPEETQKP